MTIRATYSEAFHAPTLGELFCGFAQRFPNVLIRSAEAGCEPIVTRTISGNPNLQPETAYEWTYGAVITPGKWWSALQGLTVQRRLLPPRSPWFHLTLDPQFVLDTTRTFPGQVIVGLPMPTARNDPFRPGAEHPRLPEQNLGRFIQKAGTTSSSIHLETSRFGHGDWGTLTATFNGTYIDRVVLQASPADRNSVVGKFGGGFLGRRWWFLHAQSLVCQHVLRRTGGSWLGGVDTGFTVHYVGQYWDHQGFASLAKRPGIARFASGSPWTGS